MTKKLLSDTILLSINAKKGLLKDIKKIEKIIKKF